MEVIDDMLAHQRLTADWTANMFSITSFLFDIKIPYKPVSDFIVLKLLGRLSIELYECYYHYEAIIARLVTTCSECGHKTDPNAKCSCCEFTSPENVKRCTTCAKNIMCTKYTLLMAITDFQKKYLPIVISIDPISMLDEFIPNIRLFVKSTSISSGDSILVSARVFDNLATELRYHDSGLFIIKQICLQFFKGPCNQYTKGIIAGLSVYCECTFLRVPNSDTIITIPVGANYELLSCSRRTCLTRMN